jgi:hypothetical protein
MKFEDSFLKTSFPRFVSNIALGVDLSMFTEKNSLYIYIKDKKKINILKNFICSFFQDYYLS